MKSLYDSDPSYLHGVQAETGMSRRMVYCLLDVGKLIDAGDLSRSDAEVIGWTKLQIVARHIMNQGSATEEELEGFLDIARVTKAKGLRSVLEGQNKSETRAEVFHLTIKKQSIVREALVAFGAKKKVTSKGPRLSNKEAALIKLIEVAMAGKS